MTPLLYLVAGGGILTALVVSARCGFIVGQAIGASADVKRLQDAAMTALENEARAKQEAADLRLIVARYEREAAEEAATLDRIRDGVMRKIASVSDLPEWFVVGSKHAPIVLDRVHYDGALSDTAWLSTVEELTGSRPESGASEE